MILFQDPKTGKTPECCDVGLEGGHPNCLPISIPEEDHFYSLHKKTCMNFVRVEAGVRLVRRKSGELNQPVIPPRPDCGLGPREQFNSVSSTIVSLI